MLPNSRGAQDGPTRKISPKISAVSGVTSPGGSALVAYDGLEAEGQDLGAPVHAPPRGC